ncbi:MAG: TonB-dependent receptor, partial [candidate division KSB1 bacterium]|nr:TonB-dependent receptor [candidate division KSB1 bacterium]
MKPIAMFCLGIGLALSSATSNLTAQTTTRLTGYVRDAETGLPLASANVIVRDSDRGAATDSTGRYVLSNLLPGRYLIEVRRIGYKPQVRQVTLHAGSAARLDFGLLPEPVPFKEITVVSDRLDLQTRPMLSTKISARRIAHLTPTTVSDLFKDVAGAAVSRSGSWGNKPYFQGMTDSRILVFIDGVKVNQACPMGMDACTATLEPDLIESMDVQLGPGSAQFGSGNMGGVIRVSTLGSKFAGRPDFTTEIGLLSRYQSVSRSRVQALSFSGGNSTVDFMSKLVLARHDDYRSPRGVIRNSGFDANTLHLKMRYRPDMRQQWQATAQIYRANDIGWPAANTIIPHEKRETLALSYFITDLMPKWRSLQLSLSYQPMYHNMVNYLENDNNLYSESRSQTWNASLDATWALAHRWQLRTGLFFSRWGMRAWRDTASPDVPDALSDIIPDSRLDEFGLYVESDVQLSQNLKLQIGGRLNAIGSSADRALNSQFFTAPLQQRETVFSGSAAALYQLADGIALSASLTRGFRAATPVERYIAAPMLDGYYRLGNPAIASETNVSKRVGFRGFGERVTWNLELFQHALSNMIAAEVLPDQSPPIAGLRGVKRFRNLQNATVTGISGFASVRLSRYWNVSATLAYDYGQLGADRTPLPGLAPLRGTLKWRFEPPTRGVWAELAATLAADQNRFVAAFGEVRTPGYAVFDLRAGWQVSQRLDFSVSVENLLNRYYRNHLNLSLLPEPGRNISLRLELKLPGPIRSQREPALRPEDLVRVQLNVEGMACEFCVKTVTERLSGVPGALSA